MEKSFSLSPDITSLLLGEGNQTMRTTPLDILVGLLVHLFRQIFHDPDVPSVHIEHHGREPCDGADDIDLTQTIGWFTTTYPVHIPVTSSTTLNEAIRLVKDNRYLIPKNGEPYFAFRQLSTN
jgi:hypothetical protein